MEVKNLLGIADDSTIFSRASDAVEILANKGLVDAMQGYIEIPTTSGRIVTLPRDVEVPVKVTINDNPSFSRTKLYEFMMDGPGSAYTPVDWSWEDRGGVPTIISMSAQSGIRTISNVADNGKSIFVWGSAVNAISGQLDIPVNGKITLNSVTSPFCVDSHGSAILFTKIDRVIKDPTSYPVQFLQDVTTKVLSVYAPDETDPSYRQIRLSQSGTTAHILFRRSVYRISSQDDWIPIQSRMGLFLMLKAIKLYYTNEPANIQLGQVLEKQAEQFVVEEQKSRNIFAEVASQTEKDSAKGIYFSNRDAIIVADIYDEACEICGPIGQQRIFDRITESVEALANKAQWDAMTAYLDVIVASGNVVVLPREVEIPIRVNINGNPSFSRDRLYEFTLNGPASNMLEASFSWMDQGNIPITGMLTPSYALKALGSTGSDNGKLVTVYGKDSTGLEISVPLIIDNSAPILSIPVFASISRVVKDVTVGGVTLQTSTSSVLAYYYPEEVEPSYRRIVISEYAPAVRIMFRKASIRIRSMSDLIPLSSRAAITCMLRSFEYYRSKDPQVAQMSKPAEDKAVALLQEEQKSRNIFSEFTAGEKMATLGLGINNRDSIIVSDIYDDVCDIVGKISRPNVFDKITNAVEMLSHKGQWDGQEGYVDISSVSGVVTLPRYVDYVIALNLGRRPAQMRNRWFEFHLNGPGSECQEPCEHWADLGDVVTLADLTEAQGLVYSADSSSDFGKTVRVFGYDANDQWIRENGVDGFLVTAPSHTPALYTDVTTQKVKRIDRITREATAGFAQLIAYTDGGTTSTQLGYYFPDETEPSYRRIRIPNNVCWVRIRFRKRQLKVNALTDPLMLKSRLAILSAIRSVEALLGNKSDLASSQEYERIAIQYLMDEKMVRNPSDIGRLQFDTSVSMASPENAQY